MVDIVGILVGIVVNVIFVAPIMWIAGRLLVGGQKAKFTDAIWIVVIGAVVGAVIGLFSTGLVGSLVQLVIWLYLVKRFFDCGWLKALAISIVAIVISVVIVAILALLGVALLQPVFNT